MNDTERKEPTTFAFIKPKTTERGDQTEAILSRLAQAGFHIVRQRVIRLTSAILAEHYAEHVGKAFYPPMVEYLISGPVTILELGREDGVDPVQSLRDLCGPTDPKKGRPGLIRHDFGIHDDAIIYMNAIHASGSPEEVKEELRRFFG